MGSASIRSAWFTFGETGSKLKPVVFILLLLAVFSIPLSAELQITKSTRLQFPLELFVPLCALLTAAGFFSGRKQYQFSWADGAALLFLLAALVSAACSIIPEYSLKGAAVLISYACTFYFALRFLQLSERQWQLVWHALMAAFTLLMLYTLFRYFNLGIHRKHSYEMSLPFIPGHTLLVAVGFPAFLYALNHLLQKKKVKLNLAFVLLFTFIMAISYSRIYWVIGLAAIIVMMFYHVRKIRVPLIAAMVMLGVAGGVAYKLIDAKRDRERAWESPDDHNSLFVQIKSIFVWDLNESNIERSNRWKVAQKIFEAHPITGSGLNTYPELYFWYKDQAGIQETNLSCTKMNAHQIYRGWLADMGLIGFISGVLLFLVFLAQALSLFTSVHSVFALLLFLNFAMLGAIEDYTTLEKIMAVFWVSLAYLVHLSFVRKASS